MIRIIEIASKHGINLEKYCQVASLIKSAPSPLNENAINISTETPLNVEERKCEESEAEIPSDSIDIAKTNKESVGNELLNETGMAEIFKSKESNAAKSINSSVNPSEMEATHVEIKENPVVPKTNIPNKERTIEKDAQTNTEVQNKLLKLQQILIDTILNGDSKNSRPLSSPAIQQEEPDTLKEIENKFSKDMDFRNLTCDSFIPFNELLAVDLLHNDHKVSTPVFKRKYTFYDAFENDRDSLMKRSRYFFNPIDPDYLFESHSNRSKHQKSMNFSVYSPKSDVNHQYDTVNITKKVL